MIRGLAVFGATCAMLVGAVSGAAATAADDPVAARQEIMKNVGGASRIGGQMARGDREFDPDIALLVMRILNSSIIGFRELFPEGTEGIDNRALPSIWENMTDFLDKAETLRADTAVAIANPPEALDDFRAAFGRATQNCGACHEPYRRP